MKRSYLPAVLALTPIVAVAPIIAVAQIAPPAPPAQSTPRTPPPNVMALGQMLQQSQGREAQALSDGYEMKQERDDYKSKLDEAEAKLQLVTKRAETAEAKLRDTESLYRHDVGKEPAVSAPNQPPGAQPAVPSAAHDKK